MPSAYVSAYFNDKEDAQRIMRWLEDMGFTITHDWTGESAAEKKGEELRAYAQECARADYAGVKEADLFVLQHRPEGGCGMWTEFGIALSERIPCIIIGGDVPLRPDMELLRNIFYYLGALVKVVHDEREAMEAVKAVKAWLNNHGWP